MATNFDETKWYSYTSSTQTTKSWVKRLESYADVPPEFQSAFPDHQPSFPYTLFFPEERFSRSEKRNRQILSVYEDHFVHAELLRTETKTTTGLFSDVLYLERGEILLRSWLKIVTPTDTLMIRFNTANDSLLPPVTERIRHGQHGPGLAKVDESSADPLASSPFDSLSTNSYKLMNLWAKRVLAPRIRCFVSSINRGKLSGRSNSSTGRSSGRPSPIIFQS